MTDYNLNYLKTSGIRQEIQGYIRSYERTTPLSVLVIENGIILPQKPCNAPWMGLGGVIDGAGNFVEISGIKAPLSDGLVFGGKYEYDDAELCTQDDVVLYMGAFQPQWGHFILEYCTRLWYCIKNKYDGKIAYCGFACKDGEIREPYAEFFSLLNIKKENLIDIRKPTKFKKIVIPEQALLRNRYFTEEYRNMIDFVCQNIKSDNLVPYEKIYFTRDDFVKKYKPDCEHGEKEIQQTFERNGFKILAPEKLSLSEKIFYVRNCKEFASTMGSTASNTVFASKRTKIFYIRKAYFAHIETFQIDGVTEVESSTFIDCYYKPFKKYPNSFPGGPHFIGATKEFLRFVKDQNMLELNKGVYASAILKTWFWLFKILIHDYYVHLNYNGYKGAGAVRTDEYYYYLISKKIGKIKGRKEKQFIIYPYGRMGKITKKVLNERFSVDERYIISGSTDLQSADCINFLSTMDTHCCVLFACDTYYMYGELLDLLLKYVPNEQIVELFPRKNQKRF